MNSNRKPKVKCQIITVSEYDGTPTAFEDSNHRYVKGHNGHFIRRIKKTCSLCATSASFMGIFNYRRHQRVERFCREHAASFGTLPDIPEQEEQQQSITDKEKLAILTGTKIKI